MYLHSLSNSHIFSVGADWMNCMTLYNVQYELFITAVSEKLDMFFFAHNQLLIDYLVWDSDQSCAVLAVGNAHTAVHSLPQNLSSKYSACLESIQNSYGRCFPGKGTYGVCS
jgi:hypothetical protein